MTIQLTILFLACIHFSFFVQNVLISSDFLKTLLSNLVGFFRQFKEKRTVCLYNKNYFLYKSFFLNLHVFFIKNTSKFTNFYFEIKLKNVEHSCELQYS